MPFVMHTSKIETLLVAYNIPSEMSALIMLWSQTKLTSFDLHRRI